MLAGNLLPAGNELEIEFAREAKVLIGNAGGVQMALEGKPRGRWDRTEQPGSWS